MCEIRSFNYCCNYDNDLRNRLTILLCNLSHTCSYIHHVKPLVRHITETCCMQTSLLAGFYMSNISLCSNVLPQGKNMGSLNFGLHTSHWFLLDDVICHTPSTHLSVFNFESLKPSFLSHQVTFHHIIQNEGLTEHKIFKKSLKITKKQHNCGPHVRRITFMLICFYTVVQKYPQEQ